jgi:hypothetical protein
MREGTRDGRTVMTKSDFAWNGGPPDVKARRLRLPLGVEIVVVEIGSLCPDSLLAADTEFGPRYRI